MRKLETCSEKTIASIDYLLQEEGLLREKLLN